MSFLQSANGCRLFYNDWGSGRPVVLVHGWPLNSDMWEYQASHLASRGLRVVTYDRRGFGRSDQPWLGYDYNVLADDLAALMDALDLRDVALVGFSMGGGEVARYLSRHGSSRVSQAVLISSVVPFLLKTPDHEEGVDREVFDQMVDGLEKDRPHFLAGWAKRFYGAGMLNFSVSNEVLDWTRGLALQASKKATVDCVNAFAETDFRPDLTAFTMPTLIIHGEADQIVPTHITAHAAARQIPSAQLVEYAGAPHGLFLTEKERLNRDLLSFLGGSVTVR